MCTYNGERFLQEQLDSFLYQTCLPDELVVCDDGSQDGTVEILKSFASRAPFPVSFFINPQNLGYAKNFEKACIHCQGDIIFLSDQDDIWLPEKLLKFKQLFESHPEVGFIFCNADVVNDNLQSLGISIWDHYKSTSILPEIFPPQDFINFVFKERWIYGSTFGFRANLNDIIFPIPPHWGHDAWIPFVSGLKMIVATISDQLQQYRQHSAQLFGIRRKLGLFRLFNIAKENPRLNFFELGEKWKCALSLLPSDTMPIFNGVITKEIGDYIKHYNARYNLPRSRLSRIPIVLKELYSGRYQRISSGWKSIAKDLFLSF